jgi:ankyrin repeat protein
MHEPIDQPVSPASDSPTSVNPGQKMLFEALTWGNLEVVRVLLQQNVNTVAADGVSAMEYAVAKSSPETLDVLIQHAMDVNAGFRENKTALHFATALGRTEMVSHLLGRGADVEARDDRAYTPLLTAAEDNRPKCAEILLRKNANASSRNNDGFAALDLAAIKNHADVAQVLIGFGANPNAPTPDGFTPFSLASEHNCLETAFLLYENGALLSLEQKRDLFTTAAAKGKIESLGKLLSDGVGLNDRDKRGNTALIYASEHSPETAVYLLEKGADPNAASTDGYTALIAAALGNHSDLYNLLLEKVTDVEAKSGPQYSCSNALMIASSTGNLGAAKALIERGAKLNEIDSEGYSATMLALKNGHIPLAEYLAAQGADVGITANDGTTAYLHARSCYLKIVEALYSSAAKKNKLTDPATISNHATPLKIRDTFISGKGLNPIFIRQTTDPGELIRVIGEFFPDAADRRLQYNRTLFLLFGRNISADNPYTIPKAKALLTAGANPNFAITGYGSGSTLERAISFGSEPAVLLLLGSVEKTVIQKSGGRHMYLVAEERRFLKVGEKLLEMGVDMKECSLKDVATAATASLASAWVMILQVSLDCLEIK